MKKKNIIISLILVFVTFTGYISWEYYHSSKIKEDAKLRDNIIEMVKNSKEIDISSATNFRWDTLYLFTPYTDTKKVLKKDNVRYYNSKLNMEYKDTMNIIAFVNSKKIVTYIKIDRVSFDFEPIVNNKIIRDKAVFKVANNDNRYILSLNN